MFTKRKLSRILSVINRCDAETEYDCKKVMLEILHLCDSTKQKKRFISILYKKMKMVGVI